MATSLWQLLREYKVVIPIIQRDYAQGRKTGKVPVIRERFLKALDEAISSEAPLELDFVYGYTKENKNGTDSILSFVPLDGQQRLTTLFLLHWFTAVKENHLAEAEELLSKFTYETRHSSRVFCEKLVAFKPNSLDSSISEVIIDQPWFFTAWKNDPTVNSMLVMLDAIQEKFSKIENIWPLLISDQPRIVFHLLPMEKLGLPDDLYIKMNSRGKGLTDFEYFKSQFSQILSGEHSEIFNHKIDKEWSDLFWNLYKNEEEDDIAKLVDSGFLRFFQFVTDLLIAKNEIDGESQQNEFETYKQIYSNVENVDFLFSCLNIFSVTYADNPEFFDSIFYIEEKDFKVEKSRLFFQNPLTDLFKKCADRYDIQQRINPFSIGEQLMLFACIEHLINNTNDFNPRIRKVRNLIANSEDTVRKENMKSLLLSVSAIVKNESVESDSKFNSTQLKEEENKRLFIEDKPELRATIYRVEDHHLLQGCVAAFNLEEELVDFAAAFQKVFTTGCDYETISRAMLTFGDYSQQYGSHHRFGNHNNSVWRELFTPSQRRGSFQKTKAILYALLTHLIQNPQSSLDKIISNYLDSFICQSKKPKDWNYYFVKYQCFRKWNNRNTDGFFHWNEQSKSKPYDCTLMFRTQFNGRHWSPFLLCIKAQEPKLTLEDYGNPLLLVKDDATLKITNINEGYQFEALDDDSKELLDRIHQSGWINDRGILKVQQNPEGIDLEDRIVKASEIIKNILVY